jgi:hypothetical protein
VAAFSGARVMLLVRPPQISNVKRDLLPAVRQLALPRTTRAQAAHFRRQNYLAPEFALGSIAGEAPNTGHWTPFHLAFRTPRVHCAWPMVPHTHGLVDGYFADQREGLLLAGTRWLLNPQPPPAAPPASTGRFSGLNTGRPSRLIGDPAFRPGFTVHLGPPGDATLTGGDGATLPATAGPLVGTVLVASSPSIHARNRSRSVIGPPLFRFAPGRAGCGRTAPPAARR